MTTTITAAITASSSAAAVTITGALGASGVTVTGVTLAGSASGHVGASVAGTYGALTVAANGNWSYRLDDLAPTTLLLGAGASADEHFTVTGTAGGQATTWLVTVVITGTARTGIVTTTSTTPLALPADGVISATTRDVVAASNVFAPDYNPGPPPIVINHGVLELTAAKTLYGYGPLSTGPGGNVINTGRIAVSTSDPTVTQVTGAEGDASTNSGTIIATSTAQFSGPSNGASLPQAIAWEAGSYFDHSQVLNTGLIEAESTGAATGLWADGGVITNSGEIYAAGAVGTVYGIRSGQSGNQSLTNSGVIDAVATASTAKSIGVYYFPDNTNPAIPLVINNAGTIVGQTAIYVDDGYAVATRLTNSGRIEGTVQIGPGNNLITNTASGVIAGAVTLDDPGTGNTNFVSNAGLITGPVTLSAGTNVYVGTATSAVTGGVTGGAGRNVLFAGSSATSLTGGSGRNWLVSGGPGDHLTAGSGATDFVFLAASISPAANPDVVSGFRSGTDTLDLASLAPGKVTLTASGAMTVVTAVTTSGTLTINVSGTIKASDVLTKTPASGLLLAPAGGGTVTGGSSATVIIGGAGNNVFVPGSGATVEVGGSGNNIFNLTKASDAVIVPYAGGLNQLNTIVSAALPNGISVVKLLGTNPVGLIGNQQADTVYMNDAGDYFMAAAAGAVVTPGTGADFIGLGGAGTVIYRAVADSNATAEDTLILTGPTTQVNLGALAVTGITIVAYPAPTIVNPLGAYYFNNGSVPYQEYIAGYDEVIADTAQGSLMFRVSTNGLASVFTLANLAWRPAKGSDTLTLGALPETLALGAGTDTIKVLASYAGASLASADVINGFSVTLGNVIDLSAIDANATMAGDQAFAWIGASAFTGKAGQLGEVQSGGMTYIEGDTTGAGKPNLVIALLGKVALSGANFVL